MWLSYNLWKTMLVATRLVFSLQATNVWAAVSEERGAGASAVSG